MFVKFISILLILTIIIVEVLSRPYAAEDISNSNNNNIVDVIQRVIFVDNKIL